MLLNQSLANACYSYVIRLIFLSLSSFRNMKPVGFLLPSRYIIFTFQVNVFFKEVDTHTFCLVFLCRAKDGCRHHGQGLAVRRALHPIDMLQETLKPVCTNSKEWEQKKTIPQNETPAETDITGARFFLYAERGRRDERNQTMRHELKKYEYLWRWRRYEFLVTSAQPVYTSNTVIVYAQATVSTFVTG